jgi:hypothetical protein
MLLAVAGTCYEVGIYGVDYLLEVGSYFTPSKRNLLGTDSTANVEGSRNYCRKVEW